MLRFAPLPYVMPAAHGPSIELGQPAIIKPEERKDPARLKTWTTIGIGAASVLAGWNAYERLSAKGSRGKTGGYVAAGFGVLSAGLFVALLLE